MAEQTETVTNAPVAPQAADAVSDWYHALPPGLKAEKSLESFKGKPVEALAESFVNAQKLIGGSLRVPGKESTPEEVARFREEAWRHLGRPESPEKYNVQIPKTEAFSIDEESIKDFLPVAHRLGLTNDQVNGVLQYMVELAEKETRTGPKAMAEAVRALQEGDEHNPGWGTATPRYLAVAKRAFEATFPPHTIERIIESGLGNDPDFIRAMYKIGKPLIEESFIVGEGEGLRDGKGGAEAELARIMNDPKHPYYDKTHPDHEAAVQRVLDLRRFLVS